MFKAKQRFSFLFFSFWVLGVEGGQERARRQGEGEERGSWSLDLDLGFQFSKYIFIFRC